MFKSLGNENDDFMPPTKKVDTKKVEEEEEVEGEEEEKLFPKATDNFSKQNFGYERFSIHVSTDKQQYKPKEKVYIRGILLNVMNHKPLLRTIPSLGYFRIKITNSKDESMLEGKIANPMNNSALSYCWQVPDNAAGGEYKVLLFTKMGKGGVNGERKFDVLKYQPPRFKKDLEFYQKGYSGGDIVKALLKVERSEGGYCDPENTQIVATARLDGTEIFRQDLKLTADGKCIITFPLPKEILEGIGSLNCSITEGITESKSKSLPVILKKLDCQIFPEGGELIYGIKNGVYAVAVTPNADPADFEADLVEFEKKKKKGDGRKVLKVKSLHEGKAYFEFTPKEKHYYHLKVTSPSGVTIPIELPPIKNEGIGLYVEKKPLVFGKGINVIVTSAKPKQNVFVGLFKKEECIGFKCCDEEDLVTLHPKTNDGVLRITVFQNTKKKKKKGEVDLPTDYLPVAERIVFVKPNGELCFDVKTKKETYAPGDLVEMTITANEKLIPKIEGEKDDDDERKIFCSVTVTDDSVIKEKEKRERSCRLPAQYYLENEVKELYDSGSYFHEDPDDLKKIHYDIKMDLLLGTQGWRRFVYRDVQNSVSSSQDQNRMKRLFGIESSDTIRTSGLPLGGVRKKKGKGKDMKKMEKMKKGEEEEQVAAAPIPEPEAQPEPEPEPEAEPPMEMKKECQEKKKKKKKKKMGRVAFKGKKRRRKRMMKQDILFREEIEITLPYFREYYHTHRPGRKPNQRVDFTETLFYSASQEMVLVPQQQQKQYTFSFYLNDAVSSFCVLVDGFTTSGYLGMSNSYIINVQKPFYIEPKMPLELTFGDEIYLPIAIVSNLEQPLEVEVKTCATDMLIDEKSQTITKKMNAYDRIGEYVTIKVNETEEYHQEITIEGKANNGLFQDQVTKNVDVTPFGFPQTCNFGGFIKKNSKVHAEIFLPKEIVPNSVETLSFVNPTPVGSMTKSLASLISRPGGCFEQTSMTMYPMIMAVNYFKTHADETGEGQALVEKANEFLEIGYKRLTGYECKNHGYEWFGSDPGHEALTSMGVMEFTDLSKIGFPVDMKMVKRTTDWLLKRLNPAKDAFLRNPRALDYFGAAPEKTTDAYIAYACSRSNVSYSKIQKVVERLEKEAMGKSKKDSYLVGLVGLILDNYGFRDRAKKIVEHLATFQNAMGEVASSKASITNSRGSNLSVETTAVGVIAFLRFKDDFIDNADRGVGFLNSKNSGGRFGSTQATVLALDAIITYDEATSVPKEEAGLDLFVNQELVSTVRMEMGVKDALSFDGFSKNLKVGEKNLIEIVMKGGSKMPYSINCSYCTAKPVMVEEHKTLKYSVELSNSELLEGDNTEVIVMIENIEKCKKKKKGGGGIPMTIARVCLPSGLKPRYDRLKELKKSNAFNNFELFGAREVVMYWTCMKEGEKKKIVFDCSAEIPGVFRAQASQAYLYYDDDNVNYVDGLRCVIKPKGK